jgi:hypothetical protein
MKLTVTVKLQPTPEQVDALRQTLLAANAAANAISAYAWKEQTFGQYQLHKLLYYPIRATSGLTAQVIVRLFAKVSDA